MIRTIVYWGLSWVPLFWETTIYEGINADQEARQAHLKLAGVRVLNGLRACMGLTFGCLKGVPQGPKELTV